MSLEWRCEVCKARPGEACRNTINPGEPLPGDRGEHLSRFLPPNPRKAQK